MNNILLAFQTFMQKEKVVHKNENSSMNFVPNCRSEGICLCMWKYSTELFGDQCKDVMRASVINS